MLKQCNSINIVTFVGGLSNYGKTLQAFALKSFLIPRDNVFFLYYIKKCLAEKMPILKKVLGHRRLRIMQRSNFINDLIPARLYKQGFRNCDRGMIFIAGSDQIWNPQFLNENWINVFFLNTNVRSETKRVSYAASLGMKQWPKEFEEKVLPMLQKFDAISVREESSVPYLTSLGLKNVVCVCDPTILHKGDFYRQQFQCVAVDSKPYAFIYKIRELIPDSVAEILPTNVKIVDLQKRKTMVSVTQWLANVDHAEFVVTDSFHCAVFCILFHKPFLVIPNRSHGKGMNERFATLLGKTALEYRVLSCEESKEQVLSILNRPIDWDCVDAILEEWRTYSGNWLKKALKSTNNLNHNEPT